MTRQQEFRKLTEEAKFEAFSLMSKKVTDLEAQIEKMKCGGNCKHLYHVNTGGCYDTKCDLTYCDCINCKDKWEANKLTVDEIAERCLLDGEQLGVDRLNSTPRLLQILKDRGVIKSWYYNGSYHIGEVTELEKEKAELKQKVENQKSFLKRIKAKFNLGKFERKEIEEYLDGEQLTKAKELLKWWVNHCGNHDLHYAKKTEQFLKEVEE